ncbi:TPA: hypothetical protein DEP86_01150 [Candidatus Uhrbacteria bacterium]|nr:hypothetical protein [Candidatus Uhrbacteria bacterium]
MIEADRDKLQNLASQPQLGFLSLVRERLPKSEWFLVGGAVRDALLDRINERQDLDLVVRGVGLNELMAVLEELGQVDVVGRNFGVLKFKPEGSSPNLPAIDIAWPRTEQAGGSGAYRDFEISFDPDLPIEEDLARRDFTVNALAWDFAHNELLDPFFGRNDLKKRLIRAVEDPIARLSEDLSRLLRAIRFACQLGFDIEEQTWTACVQLAPKLNDTHQTDSSEEDRIIPYEIIAKELVKSLRANASRALELFLASGLVQVLLPELRHMVGTEQPVEYHSEGDVWTHTVLALRQAISSEFIQFFNGEIPTIETLLAVALHDIGKSGTINHHPDGHISFHGHDSIGADSARELVERLRLSSVTNEVIRPERIWWLVRWHMFPLLVDLDHVRKTRLAALFLDDPEAGQQLLQLSYCDRLASIPQNGKSSLDGLIKLMDELKELSGRSANETKWLLSGEEVMETLGLEPGPEVGRLIEELHEAQLSGEIYDPDGAKDWLLQYRKIE